MQTFYKKCFFLQYIYGLYIYIVVYFWTKAKNGDGIEIRNGKSV